MELTVAPMLSACSSVEVSCGCVASLCRSRAVQRRLGRDAIVEITAALLCSRFGGAIVAPNFAQNVNRLLPTGHSGAAAMDNLQVSQYSRLSIARLLRN